MKPERVWKVGERIFDSYEEARDYATKNRKASIIDQLAEIIIQMPPDMGSMKDASELAQEILDKFNVTRKRAP